MNVNSLAAIVEPLKTAVGPLAAWDSSPVGMCCAAPPGELAENLSLPDDCGDEREVPRVEPPEAVVEEQEAPPAAPAEAEPVEAPRRPFECKLERASSEEPWGLTLDLWSSFLEVSTIKDFGDVKRHGKIEVGPERSIHEGDLILRVDDCTKDSREMSARLKDPTRNEVSLLVCPSQRVAMTVLRQDSEPWGVRVEPSENKKALYVTVAPKACSPIYMRNQGIALEYKVQLGDIIKSVNGRSGKVESMMEAMMDSTATNLELDIMRPMPS